MILPDRREFLRMIVRDGLLAGIGFLSVSLAGRRSGSRSESGCPPGRICQGCGHLSHCPATQAGEARIKRTKESDRTEPVNGESIR